jgi:la-related protein 1
VNSSPRKTGKSKLPDEPGPGVVTGSSGYIYSPRRPPRALSPDPTPQQPGLPVVSPVPVYGDYYVSPPPGPPHLPIPPPLSQGHSPQPQTGYRTPYHPQGPNDFVAPIYPVSGHSPVSLPQGYPYPSYPNQPYGFEYGQPQLQGTQFINWNGQTDRQQDYAPPHLPSPSHGHSPNISSQQPLPQAPPHVPPSDLGQQGHERNADRVVTMFGSIGANGVIDAAPKEEVVKEKHYVFGSIGAGVDQATPSPAVAPVADTIEPKAFTAFSIGVTPGEPGPSRLRSRTRSTKARSRAQGINGDKSHALEKAKDAELEVKVIDLTETEPKWDFASSELLDLDAESPTDEETNNEPPVQNDVPVIQPTEVHIPEPEQSYPPPSAPNGLQIQMQALTPITLPPPAPYSIAVPPTLPHQSILGNDEFLEVQDFGFGFGPVSGTGYGPLMTRDLRDRERERERDRDRFEWNGRGGADWSRGREVREREIRGDPQREFRERDAQREFRVEREFAPSVPGRPRRGSAAVAPVNGGFAAERGGGFGGRRGRGFGGRGFRGFGRGNFPQQQQQQQPQPQQQQQQPPPPRQPPFVVTPPTNFQSLQSQSPVEPASAYFPPQTTYYPTPSFEVYQTPVPGPTPAVHPVPVPLSAVPFPLDPTRWQLLGQLEYYLSPQNMVSDFFLRQRVCFVLFLSVI